MKTLICKRCGDEYETDKQQSALCEQCINESEPIVSAESGDKTIMTPLQREELDREIEYTQKDDFEPRNRRQDNFERFIANACYVVGCLVIICFVSLTIVHLVRYFTHE